MRNSALSQKDVSWICFGISAATILLFYAFNNGVIFNRAPEENIPILYFIVVAIVLGCSIVLGAIGNYLKFFHPAMVVVFPLLLYFFVVHNNSRYLYLHHNHGVNSITLNAGFYFSLIACAILGLVLGVVIRMFYQKMRKKPH